VGRRDQIPAGIAEVFITDELALRPAPKPDYLREKLAIQDLAQIMADRPNEVLPRLVKLAMEICGAESAGISLFEPDTMVFRWHYLFGILERFNGATTPRNHSPCGVCLDLSTPILMKNPEKVYAWISDAGIVVPEVLLVPLFIRGEAPLGTLWVVAPESRKFDSGHSRVLSELAGFAGIALRMIHAEEKLNAALQQQETLTQEMSHRIKNLFTIADGMIRMTARSSTTKEELAENLSGRLHALAKANTLVRKAHDALGAEAAERSNMLDVIGAILKPYATNIELSGPDVPLGQDATTAMALIFHELATNAAKYGALHNGGTLKIAWTFGDDLQVKWIERGGPTLAGAPQKTGFGANLVKSAVTQRGGAIDYAWLPEGVEVTVTLPVNSLAH
jgi:two-component sensor histidine kinase